jgi:hypothetical protein
MELAMAKSTRASARAPKKRAPKRALARALKKRAAKKSVAKKRVAKKPAARKKPAAKKKPAASKAKSAAPVRRDGRCLSRRIEFTPRLIEHIRQRYEQAGDSPELISRSVGVAKATIQRLVREYAWTTARREPRDLSPSARLLMEAEALEARRHPEVLAAGEPRRMTGSGGRSSFEARSLCDLAPQDDGEGAAPAEAPEQDAAPEDFAAAIDHLLRATMRELAGVEAMQAEMKNMPQRPRDAHATAQALASLTETVNKLQRLRCGLVDSTYDDSDDECPRDLDEFRLALARRIDAFVTSRLDDGDAERGDDPAG